MGFTTCVHCQTRVLPDADGRCPSCGHLPGEVLDGAARAEIDRRLAEDARSDAMVPAKPERSQDDPALRLERQRTRASLAVLGIVAPVLAVALLFSLPVLEPLAGALLSVLLWFFASLAHC
jgi:hypothetical protein